MAVETSEILKAGARARLHALREIMLQTPYGLVSIFENSQLTITVSMSPGRKTMRRKTETPTAQEKLPAR
jgi:hypothetical protein